MNKLAYKLTTGVVTGALLVSVAAPAVFADTSVRVARNGSGSKNKVKVNKKHKTKVRQKNANAVINIVGVFQNTGGNSVNGNTGDGNVTVGSGNVVSNVSNMTTTRGNVATINACDCLEEDTSVVVRRNGSRSRNKVRINSTNSTRVEQSNYTLVVNGVIVAQNTGGNSADDNTGDGDVSADSGNTNATVANETTTGGNTLNP